MARPKPTVLPDPVCAETSRSASSQRGVGHGLLHGGQGVVAALGERVGQGLDHLEAVLHAADDAGWRRGPSKGTGEAASLIAIRLPCISEKWDRGPSRRHDPIS